MPGNHQCKKGLQGEIKGGQTGISQAGDCVPGQDGCEAPLTEHSLQEGPPALPFLQDLEEGCSLQACTSGSSY